MTLFDYMSQHPYMTAFIVGMLMNWRPITIKKYYGKGENNEIS